LFLHFSSFFFLMIPRPPISTLFPYTTLFRSHIVDLFIHRTHVVISASSFSSIGHAMAVHGQRYHYAQSTVFGPSDPINPHLLVRSEEHTSELQSLTNLVCRLLLEKKKNNKCT